MSWSEVLYGHFPGVTKENHKNLKAQGRSASVPAKTQAKC
jgi:hypothetical protein